MGLTTTPITEQVIARVRGRVANPAHAAALVTLLFTGAIYRELTFLPRCAITGDTVIFPSTHGADHPADLGVWVIPPLARPLLHAAVILQETRAVPAGRLFAHADREGRQTAPHRPHVRADAPGPAPLAQRLAPPGQHPQLSRDVPRRRVLIPPVQPWSDRAPTDLEWTPPRHGGKAQLTRTDIPAELSPRPLTFS